MMVYTKDTKLFLYIHYLEKKNMVTLLYGAIFVLLEALRFLYEAVTMFYDAVICYF